MDKRNIRLLEYWGKNSIKILCLHGFIIEIIRLVDYKIFGNVLVCMGRWEGVVFTRIIMIILTSSMPLINKFLSTYLSTGDVALRINTTIYCINFYFLKQYIVYKSFSATAP